MTFQRIAPSRLEALSLIVVLALQTGCTNLSGLGGSSEFHCKAPEGVPCQSISGVSANERAGTLPGRPAAKAVTPSPEYANGATPTRPAAVPAAYFPGRASPPGDAPSALGAIRSDPTQIRIWIAPWEDADGDLNDAQLVYLQIDSGRWLIEHNRERIRREFAPKAANPALAMPAPAASAPARAATANLAPPLPSVAPAALAARPAAAQGTTP